VWGRATNKSAKQTKNKGELQGTESRLTSQASWLFLPLTKALSHDSPIIVWQ
jgi:hypothetical protein